MHVAPHVAQMIAVGELAEFVQKHGVKDDKASKPDTEVYEMDRGLQREFVIRQEQIVSAAEGLRLLPNILIIGLISTYDAFLASLMRVVCSKHPEIVLTSERQLTFKSLLEFSSIDDARRSIIDREIDAVIRRSHQEQFDWLEKHLSVKLRDKLTIWPDFVELCERRNLFTHTGGVVSAQYIKNCNDHKYKRTDIRIGQKLSADAKYFRSSVAIIHEIGLKLCYVFWRKFDGREVDEADSAFNQKCMDLIHDGSYSLAEALLSFSCGVRGVKDRIRRMMVVNYANSVRLQGRKEEAKKVLSDHDWSASNQEFQLSVAAVSEDVAKVVQLMKEIGTQMPAENYRDWPVFRGVRDDARVIEAFEKIYGKPLQLIENKSGPAMKAIPSTPERNELN